LKDNTNETERYELDNSPERYHNLLDNSFQKWMWQLIKILSQTTF